MAATTSTTEWPDASNTGVPAGVTLTPSGSLVITQAGAVVSGLNITGTVIIDAPNVTLENCSITSSSNAVVKIASGITGATVENCTINGTGANNSGDVGIWGAGTFIGNNIYNVENGIALDPGASNSGPTVIENNYIHNMLASGSPHYDGIQIDGGDSNVTISHNTIINQNGTVSAIMIDNYFGPISNITVNDNLLAGGGFTIYSSGQFNGGSVTGVSITNNHMASGTWGYTDFAGSSPTYTGNVNDGATLIATLNTPANDGGSTTPTAPAAPAISSWSPDTGVAGDGITNATVLTLKGTAVAGSTVNVYDGSTQVATATASSTGAWTAATSTLSNGAHVLTATDTVSGVVSAASTAVDVTVDTVAPAAPVETSDSVVNGNQAQISGTAEANSTITVYDGTTAVGTGVTSATGSWSVTTSALASGSQPLTATATDVAGNVSAHSQAVDPVIGAPAAPAISSWSPDTGVVGDGVTDAAVLTLTGTAAAGSTVHVYDGSTLIGTVTASSTGAWTDTTPTLSNAEHVFTATATTSSGTSVASAAVDVTVDTVAPAAPVLTSDTIVNADHVQLSGTAEANSTITIYDGATAVGTGVTSATGSWSVTTSALANGSQPLTATATDVAGNVSAHSQAVDPVIAASTSATEWPDASNTGVPAGVTLTPSGSLVITQAGAVVSGLNITGTVIIDAPNVTLENCSITSSSNAVVKIASGITGATVENCTINGTGANNSGDVGIWGAGTFIGNNIYNVENGIALDPGASNSGPTVIENNYIHNMLASGSPHYDGIQIDGGDSNVTISHNTIINQNGTVSAIMIDNYFGPISNITVNDNLLAGGGFTIYSSGQFNGGSVTGVSITNNHMASGTWGYTDFAGSSPTYTGNVNDGATLIATLNTPANDGGSTTPTAPAAPAISSWSPDTGVAGDGITNATVLTLKGTAVAGSTVNVYDGSTQVATATASSTGAWTAATSTLSNGAHVLTATDTVSGVVSAASTAVDVTVDTVAPAAPVETSDSVVNGNQAQISGTAEANSTITVYDGTTAVGTGVTSATGSWTVTTSALSSGSQILTATATDAAGNVSAHSQSFDPVIGATSGSSPSSGSTLSDGIEFTHLSENSGHIATINGTAEANSTIKLYDGDVTIGTVTANSSGDWTFQTAPLTNTVHAFTAQQVDGAGHVVATSSGEAILGTNGSNTLTGTSGDDYFVANGHPDTFVFAASFGHDVIQGFSASGSAHDTIQFASSEFANFASVLAHASQVGVDVVIASGSDSLTLKNTQLKSLTSHDFHFA